ncbi:hypothetical protein [Mycolicibacterium sp.]|uniref:hypothetical protein n=1 Tax=Mycolicibacterium sp. TaxID=2320850 RepID=UPI0037C76785
MSAFTHVLEQDNKSVTSMGGWTEPDEFGGRLRRFNGADRFALVLWPLPDDMDYEQAVRAGRDALEYLQAGGSADALTVEIRKPGGSTWGAEWVRYVIGHPHTGEERRDVPITLPRSTELVAPSEVFGADEAADLFYHYYKTGDIPDGYTLRPVQGFTSNGDSVDLSAVTN